LIACLLNERLSIRQETAIVMLEVLFVDLEIIKQKAFYILTEPDVIRNFKKIW